MQPQQTYRPYFARQPARFLLVDLSHPFDSVTCQVLTDSLNHFLSLACSLSGPCRLPFFGLSAMGVYPEVLYPLQTIRGNYGRLCSALSELETCLNDLGGTKDHPSSVSQGIREAADMFIRQSQNMLQMAGYWTQLELTVVTAQSPATVVQQVDKAISDLSMDILKKAQVLHINVAERVSRTTGGQDTGQHISSQVSSESTKDGESDGLHGLVDCVTLDEDGLSLENFFKGWLQDCSTDLEHLHLILSTEQGSEVVLKCDLHERLLSSDQLPAAESMTVHSDNTATNRLGTSSGPKSTSGTKHQCPLYRLRAVRRVAAEGVCESVLYGLPVIVRPTSCWKMDWDDLETNQQHFNALSHLLREKDQFLLAISEPTSAANPSGSGFRYQVAPPAPRGHFMLLPSGGGSLLLKAVGVAELAMPCEIQPAECPSEGSLSTVQAALQHLNEVESYNPLLETSGFYKCLEAQLLKNQPTGNSHTKRKLPAPTIKAASTLPVRPLAQVKRNQTTTKTEPLDSSHVTGVVSGKRRQRQVSGRDFYSSNDFPSEL